MGEDVVVKRRLFYARLGEDKRHEFFVVVRKPFLLKKDAFDFPINEGAAGCVTEFEGLPERGDTCHGYDAMQALQMAVACDWLLRRYRKKYDFSFPGGEPYFDEESDAADEAK